MDAEPGAPRNSGRQPSSRPGVRRGQQVVRGIGIGIGVGIALVGAGLVAIATVDLATGGDGTTSPVTSAGQIVLFGAMIWWGIQIGWPELAPRPLVQRLLARRAARQTPAPLLSGPTAAEAERERRVLRLAEGEQGRVTALEVASRCDLTAEEAKALLDGLVLRGVAQLRVSETGVLVYVFRHLLPGSDRDRRWK
jgi:hypothetical protein